MMKKMKSCSYFFWPFPIKHFSGVNLGKFQDIWVFLKAVLNFSYLILFPFFLISAPVWKKGRMSQQKFLFRGYEVKLPPEKR